MAILKIKYRINVYSVHLNVKLVKNQLLIVPAVTLKGILKIFKLKINLLISIHALIARMINLKINKTIVNNATPSVKLVLNQVRHA
jgi:hypothetical protein